MEGVSSGYFSWVGLLEFVFCPYAHGLHRVRVVRASVYDVPLFVREQVRGIFFPRRVDVWFPTFRARPSLFRRGITFVNGRQFRSNLLSLVRLASQLEAACFVGAFVLLPWGEGDRVVAFLRGTRHVSFQAGRGVGGQFVPRGSSAAPINDRNVGDVFVANDCRRPFFASNFGRVVAGLTSDG